MEKINIEMVEIKSLSDLEEMAEIWRRLEKGGDMTVFQSHEWNKLLLEEEKKKYLSSLLSTVMVIKISKSGTVLGLLPLVVQRLSNKTKWFGRKKGLYILGHSSYSDYLNLVYEDGFDDACFNELLKYMKKNFRGFSFYATDIRANTKFAACLRASGAVLDKTNVAVQVEKTGVSEDYVKSLSKHVRQNLRTAKNRMDKAHIGYELKVFGRLDDTDLIDQLVEIHIGRMAEKNMVDTDFLHKVSSRIRISYRRKQEHNNNVIAESMKRMENSCLAIVYLNNDIAGYLYGLRDGSVVRIMQNCVKDEYKFYSPMFRGAYDFIIEQYADERITAVDFTRGNEQYKYSLGGIEIGLESHHIIF